MHTFNFNAEQLLNEEAAARELGVSLSSIRRLRKAGALPSTKLGPGGRILRYRLSDLRAFVERRRTS